MNGVLDLLHHGFTKSKLPVRNATIELASRRWREAM